MTENSGTVTITGSTFSGNSASSGGGADLQIGPIPISQRAPVAHLTREPTFSGNWPPSGGAIYFNNGLGKITGSTFSNNTAILGRRHLHLYAMEPRRDQGQHAFRELGRQRGRSDRQQLRRVKITNSTISGNSRTAEVGPFITGAAPGDYQQHAHREPG